MDISLIVAKAEAFLRQGAPKRAQVLVDGVINTLRESERAELYDLLGRIHIAQGRDYLVRADELGLGERFSVQPFKPSFTEEETDGEEVGQLEQMRLRLVIDALEECNWVQSAAANAIGMSKYQIHRFLGKHGLLERVKQRRVGKRD